LSENPEVTEADIKPLVHYLTAGVSKYVNPHPLFDTSYYLSQSPDVGKAGENPLVHYVLHGWRESFRPHPLFDAAHYFSLYPDIASAGMNPLIHFLLHGAGEGRDPHGHFDALYYLSENPDVAAAKVNPLVHYVTAGFREGRQPNAVFDMSRYVAEHPDADFHTINPLVHFLRKGEPFDLLAALRAEYALSDRAGLINAPGIEPQVSIVIPYLDSGEHLEEALISGILACSYPMEIVVVASDSLEKEALVSANSVTDRYRARLVSTGVLSLNDARRTGIELARGEFIQILGAEDFLASGKIDFQIELFQSNRDLDICLSNFEECDEGGLVRWRPQQPPDLRPPAAGHSLDDLLPVHCGLFKRSFLKKHPMFQMTLKNPDQAFWAWVRSLVPNIRRHSEVLATERRNHDRS
jgi:hypothetical protein